MATQIVGVDIGQAMLRAVEIENPAKPRPTVLRYHEVALPEGAVRSGEVVEEQTVATALKHLWTEGKFRSRNVVLGLGNQKVLARDLTVPRMSLKRIRESLPFQVQDLIPVPVADALLDFYPIAQTETEGGPAVSGLLVVAVKDAVIANVNAVQQAGLSPVAVDLIPFALQRAVGVSTPGTTALIDVGATTTNIVVSTAGVPQFVRIIPAGGEDLTRALMLRLQLERPPAEQLKAGLGMTNRGLPEQEPAVEVIYEISRELLNSLRNTVNYFVNTREHGNVERIVLTGGAAQLPGFAAALAQMTNIPVVPGDPFANVTLGRDVHQLAASTHRQAAVALGLAIGWTA